MRSIVALLIGFLCLSLSVDEGKYASKDKEVWVESRISSMSLEQKINQSFIVLLDLNWSKSKITETLDYIRINSPGGVFVRGGTTSKARSIISELKNQSLVPIYVSTQANYGVAESFFEKRRFPYPLTMAAADSLLLTNRIGDLIAQEIHDLGVNVNFSNVAHVYSNPFNSDGYMLSFGENPRQVSKHCDAFISSFKRENVALVPQGFPGNGDVDRVGDEFVCQNPSTHIEAIDLMPFRNMIKDGVGLLGMSIAKFPAYDSVSRATESKVIIHDLLRGSMGYNAVVVSASMENMSIGLAVNSYTAGCDMLLKVEDPRMIINRLTELKDNGGLNMEEIDSKCRRILSHKYDNIVKAEAVQENSINAEWTVKTVFENAQIAIKNNGVLPIKRFDQRIAIVSIGSHVEPLWSSISRSADIDCYHAYSVSEAIDRYSDVKSEYDLIITSLHSNLNQSHSRHYDGLKRWISILGDKKNILLINGNPKGLQGLDKLSSDAILVSFENHPFSLDRMGELVMGATSARSELPVTLSEGFKRGDGEIVPWAGRLSESDPSVLGISSKKLKEIDDIVNNGIENKAFPGCQVLVAVGGKVIYRKNFGYQTYDTTHPVLNNTIYDVASVTKVVSSTASVMRLQSQGQFSLDSSLSAYLDFVDSTRYQNMVIRDMMAHQAGLYPWIPFYTKTMSGGVHDSTIYSPVKTSRFSSRVSTNLWIDPSYEEKMYDKILETSLGRKSYKYSDLGYYFLKRIIEKKSGLEQDRYVYETFYKPMGLQTIGYNPLDRFTLDRIPPTEDDKIFRKELVHGYVHDQGTAMLGGVGGHAGIFSNSWDLAAMMQLFLNGGKYGAEFISGDVINEFTSCQFCPGNRRGAGFDKPVRSLKGGPTCGLVSLDSYGHSGFTGTFVWSDPKYQINYVFLSNRVYPDAENWKIVSMNIRSDIQRVIYEAVLQGSH